METTSQPATETLGTTATVPAPEPMLIDDALPEFHFTRAEHLVVDADVATTWRGLLATDLLDVHTPLMDAAFWARGLPARLRGVREEPGPAALPLGGDVGMKGWLSLGRREYRELALGAVGRFWEPDITWRDVGTVADFAAFDDPGWGRIAANFSLRDYGTGRTLLSYEARTAVPDAASRRKFGRYWRVIEPFVGHMMRATERAIAEQARRSAGSA